MSAGQIWYFIKFFEQEEYADQFINGTLYLNRLSYFREIENSSDNATEDRFDKTEALTMWWQPHDFIMELKIPGVGEVTITKDDLAAPVYMSYSDIDNFHIFCMYAVHTAGFATIGGKLELAESQAAELQRQVAIDERCVKFGPFAVIIHAVPFLSQVKQKLQRNGQWFRGNLVDYYDDETFHGEISPNDPSGIPFKKQNRFAWQKEFRICVQTNTTGSDPLLIDIGNISHICAKVPSSRVGELFKLSKLQPGPKQQIEPDPNRLTSFPQKREPRAPKSKPPRPV